MCDVFVWANDAVLDPARPLFVNASNHAVNGSGRG
jgi:hypothetical protein